MTTAPPTSAADAETLPADQASRTAIRAEDAALQLLAPSALILVLIAAALTLLGPSERLETNAWLVAFGAAVPGGLWIGSRQALILADAAPAATARAVAIGAGALGAALVAFYAGPGGVGYYALAVAAGLGALLAPSLAARRWRDPADDDSRPAYAATAFVVVVTLVLFAPSSSLRGGAFSGGLLAAGALLLALRVAAGRRPPRWIRRLVDGVSALLIVGFVSTFVDVRLVGYPAVHHEGFFLGPANDVLHGRPMLDGTWSQYGVGLITALAAFFSFNAIGFGHLFLLGVALMCLQYVCVLATLRLAGVGHLLAAAAVFTAALGNIYALQGIYPAYPSITPLRFGLPYLLVLCAVLGARHPTRRGAFWAGQLALLGVAAVWSFESWVYTVGAFGSVVLVNALATDRTPLRRVLVCGAQGIGASLAAVGLFSAVTWLWSGGVDWGPYGEYLRLYSQGGLGQTPVMFYSPGLVMAAVLFLSAVAAVWIARTRPTAIESPVLVAIAGFTGFAIAAFTYYLGRSVPNNLLNLLVPPVAIGFLWVHAAIGPGRGFRPLWRWVVAGGMLSLAGMIAASSWASVKPKWPSSGLALVTGTSPGLGTAVRTLWDNPVMDPRAPEAVALLKQYMPDESRSVVLTEPDLTTEILMSADRANVLPISHPPEDDLIARTEVATAAVARSIPAGTRVLLSPAPIPAGQTGPLGGPRDFLPAQTQALQILNERFRFNVLATSPSGFQVVRLAPKN